MYAATKSYAVFLDAFADFSKMTVVPSTRISLHLPVFLTWHFSTLPSISQIAMNRLGLFLKMPVIMRP